MPKQFTIEDLLALTEGTIENMQLCGEISDEDVERWYNITEEIDAYFSKYTYFDAQFC